MVLLHLMAKEYSKRPSEIVGVTDEWAAYDFDAAVFIAAQDELNPDRRKRAGRPTPAQMAKRATR